MGEVLFELDQVLRAKKYNMTVQERNTLLNCKSKAIKDYTVGALFGAGVAWIGTSKLSMFGRIGIAAGASAAVGLWRLGTSLDSSIDQILTLQESSMQRELASIVVKKYWNDPWRMQLISKHFYSERVFDDSNVDLPKVRWRFRNFFSDDGSLSQTTHGSDSHGESQSASRGDYNSNTQRDPSGIRTDSRRDFEGKFKYESKQAPMNTALDSMDPFDCFFGYPSMEEIPHPSNPSTTSPRTHTRNHRRAQRRRRMRHQDALLNSQHA
ncbi:uncharacterized protein LOC115722994 [Cannabis sativa]|uniref:Uncharacterized protein n=3 Tax=Cannabis sativa TaxID=3483 RepID=A0AB40ECE5_CANSA|nr:uncharacterized protein LOC115722994 [Cannabis sativa]KAF4363521.1 hypothetical protein G4B88_022082 [Cannabis sativa]KAF4367830.1 hypothetical protein G4B88_003309 [Cannabis sativa]